MKNEWIERRSTRGDIRGSMILSFCTTSAHALTPEARGHA